jgi:hypothetical protein
LARKVDLICAAATGTGVPTTPNSLIAYHLNAKVTLIFQGHLTYPPSVLRPKQDFFGDKVGNSVIMRIVASGNEKSYVFRDLP